MALQGCACHCLSNKYFYLVVSTCLQDPVQLVLDLCSHHFADTPGVQDILQGLGTHRKLRELLQPPHTRQRAGAWLLGVELLLSKLPPKDMADSIQAV